MKKEVKSQGAVCKSQGHEMKGAISSEDGESVANLCGQGRLHREGAHDTYDIGALYLFDD